MKKFLKKIFITLITTIIATMTIYGSYTIYAGETYEFQKVNTINTMVLYHEAMNKLFNKSLEKAVKMLDDPKILSKDKNNLQSPCKASDFPKEAKKCEKLCESNTDNVSTYCVSVRATDMYLAYIGHLGQLQGSVNFESLGWAELRVIPATDLLYQAILARDKKITKDIEESRRVLEATLGAYNEFIIAYPIHKQYQTVIKNLIKYKNKLKDIRKYLIQFPSTFVDTTSTKCS